MNSNALRFVRTIFVGFCILALFVTAPSIGLAGPKEVAEAKQAVADAQAAVKTAQEALDKAKANVKAELAKTPEYAQADEALAKAKSEHDATTRPVLDKTRASADYQIAKKTFEDAEAKLKTLKSGASSGSDTKSRAEQITSTTNQRTTAKTKMEQLETAALTSDPKVQAAKQAVADAQAKLDEAGKKLDGLVANDAACQEAKTNLDDANKKLTEAKEALVAAQKQAQEEAKNRSRGGRGGKGGGGGAAGGGAK
jgi:hypothetical protein